MGEKTKAMLGQYEAVCRAADDLESAAADSFRQHPDAEIITSLPGLGMLTGARVLGELGDDPDRFADARGLKAYAGAAPITRASGKSLSVSRRRVKNDRLASVGYVWAFATLTASPGAKALYQRCRDGGRTTPPPSAGSTTGSSAASTTAYRSKQPTSPANLNQDPPGETAAAS